jgi:hypothetical protein
MRGHEAVIAMRMRGVKPAVVSVSTDPLPPDVWRQWPEYLTTAQVEIEAKDRIPLLDHALGRGNIPLDLGRRRQPVAGGRGLCKALKAAGRQARGGDGLCGRDERGPRMVSMHDTEGALTWQA